MNKDRESRFILPNPFNSGWIPADFDSGIKEGAIIDSRLLAKRREENRDRIERERNIGRKGSVYDPLTVNKTRFELRRK